MLIRKLEKEAELTSFSANKVFKDETHWMKTNDDFHPEVFIGSENKDEEVRLAESYDLYVDSPLVGYLLRTGVRDQLFNIKDVRSYFVGPEPELYGELCRLAPRIETVNLLRTDFIQWQIAGSATSTVLEYETPESITWYWHEESKHPNKRSIMERIGFLAKEARLDEEDEDISLDSLKDLLTFIELYKDLPRPSLTVNPIGLISATWNMYESQLFELIIRFFGNGQVDALLAIKHVSLLSGTESCSLKNVPYILVFERLKPYGLFLG